MVHSLFLCNNSEGVQMESAEKIFFELNEKGIERAANSFGRVFVIDEICEVILREDADNGEQVSEEEFRTEVFETLVSVCTKGGVLRFGYSLFCAPGVPGCDLIQTAIDETFENSFASFAAQVRVVPNSFKAPKASDPEGPLFDYVVPALGFDDGEGKTAFVFRSLERDEIELVCSLAFNKGEKVSGFAVGEAEDLERGNS